MNKMNGKFLKDMSWEKQRYFLLDNGFIVRLEYNPCYDWLVAAIHDKDNKQVIYHVSSGHEAAPEWLQEWEEPVTPGHWMTVYRPKFEKIWEMH
jgi:hypothetical protein